MATLHIDFAARIRRAGRLLKAADVGGITTDGHNNLVVETDKGTITINARHWKAFATET